MTTSFEPAVAAFGNLLGPDTLVIFLIILIFFGAKKLPELARSMGQAMREFSKAKDDFEREITRPPTQEQAKQIDQPAPQQTAQSTPSTSTDHPVEVEVHPPAPAPAHHS